MSNPIPCGGDFDVCPFCGVRPTIEPWHGGPKTKRMVACDNEECDVSPHVTGDTDLLARDKWNRRAPSVHSEEFPTVHDGFFMAALTGITAGNLGLEVAMNPDAWVEEAQDLADAAMKRRAARRPQ